MAETPSNMFPLGKLAPDFSLLEVQTQKIYHLSEQMPAKATVILFICNHCPYVIHIREKLLQLARAYQKKGVRFIAISSNETENYPEDSPEKMKDMAEKHAFPFPYLFDETQTVAKAYQAACTPDFYLFDEKMECVYRGRFDESTPKNNKPVTGKDLEAALRALLLGQTIDTAQYPSLGCNIKWK